MRKTSFEPLTGVLEPWFESDKLPEAIQERIRLGFPPGDDSPRNRGAMVLAQMWETLGPGNRRELARQWDYNNDPANEAEQHRMFKLQNIQSELKDRITKIEIGPIQDAAARDIHLQKLKKELADVEDSIYQLATEAAGVYPPRRGPVPQKTLISACEALTWIAWGEPKTLEEINRDAVEKFRRRGDVAPLSANDTERDNRDDQLLARARTDLIEALRAETITARGQRRHPDGRRNRNAEHLIISLSVLSDPRTTVTHHNMILVNPDLGFSEAQEALGKAYDDVQFKTSEIIEHWPAMTATQIALRAVSDPASAEDPLLPKVGLTVEEAAIGLAPGSVFPRNAKVEADLRAATVSKSEELRFPLQDIGKLIPISDEGDPGTARSEFDEFDGLDAADWSVPLDDLPAYWTLHQTIAWIMFRDAFLVRRISGGNNIRFHIVIYSQQRENPAAIVVEFQDAEISLMIKLRAGAILAEGAESRQGKSQFAISKRIPLSDMTDLWFGEESKNLVLQYVPYTGHFWYNVKLSKDRIIAIWPPVGTAVEGEPAPPCNTHGPSLEQQEEDSAMPPDTIAPPTVRNPRGPRPEKRKRVESAMMADLRSQKLSPEDLRLRKEKQLVHEYDVGSRQTVRQARNTVLAMSEFQTPANSDKQRSNDK